MAVGPLAQLALNRAMVRALREHVAALTGDADRRAQEAYDAGLRRGRAAWIIAYCAGAAMGALAVAVFA